MTATSSNARKHESRNPLQRALLGHFTRTLCKVVAGLRPRSVLDVGCGEGYVLAALREAGVGAELVGVDGSAAAVAAARARLGSGATIVHGDVRTLELGRRFDVVLMIEVLEHLPDPAVMLPVLDAVAADHLVLSVPHEPLFRGLNLLRGRHLRGWGNHPEHLQQFGRREFIAFVERRFEVVQTPLVPPWTMVVARRRAPSAP